MEKKNCLLGGPYFGETAYLEIYQIVLPKTINFSISSGALKNLLVAWQETLDKFQHQAKNLLYTDNQIHHHLCEVQVL